MRARQTLPAKSAWKARLRTALPMASDHGAWRPGARRPCGREVHAMMAKAAVVAASPTKSQKNEPAARKPAQAEPPANPALRARRTAEKARKRRFSGTMSARSALVAGL